MTLALLMLTLRMKAVIRPEPAPLPRLEINWQETHACRRGRRPHKIVESAFNDVRGVIEKATGLKVLVGKITPQTRQA